MDLPQYAADINSTIQLMFTLFHKLWSHLRRENMRQDGRLENGIREVAITPNFIKNADGSCLISVGETKVICTATVEDKVPPFLKGQGTGWVTSEYGMIPASCNSRVSRESTRGKKTGRTHEIQRLIGRSMRGVVDLISLGERTVWIDCDVIQADGGTRCASITGSFVALCLALDKLKKDGTFNKLPITESIAAISVGIIKGKVYLDLNYSEDSNADVDANIVMTSSSEFVEIQGTAEDNTFSKDEFNKILEYAEKGIMKLIDKQNEVLGGILS